MRKSLMQVRVLQLSPALLRFCEATKAEQDALALLVSTLRSEYAAIASDAFGGECGPERADEVASVLFDRVNDPSMLAPHARVLARNLSRARRIELVRIGVL